MANQSYYDPMAIFNPTPVPTPIYPVGSGYVNPSSQQSVAINPFTAVNSNPNLSINPGSVLGGITGGSQPSQPSQPPQPPPPSGPTPEELARQQYENQVRGDINSGYDNYLSSLTAQLNGYLPEQYQNQLGIVNNSYNQGVSDLGFQKDTGIQDLNKSGGLIDLNQKKSLKSLSDNMRNMFMAGNNYLGTMGASDSSASNQYSYALNKISNQARGDIMATADQGRMDIEDKKYRLGQIYNQETNRLRTEADNNKLSVAQWFADSQQQIKNAIASGELSRSTDIANLSRSLLDSALNKLNLAQTEASNRRASLESWALSNSQNLSQLATNMAGVAQYSQPNLSANISSGQPYIDAQGNYRMPIGYNATDTSKKVNGLFG